VRGVSARDMLRCSAPRKDRRGRRAREREVAHPQMFDPDDPWLAHVRVIALALPGADEKVSHGRPAFFTRKVFAYYGAAIRDDGAWVQHEQAIVFLPGPDERPALETDPRSWVPAYLGPAGWLGLDLDERTDLGEVAELLEESFRLTAPARLVAALDSRGP
jgi:predicted DNA-binding protein (MmcQ/YjbR family)